MARHPDELWPEDQSLGDAEVDAAWLAEIQRRSKEIDDGLVETIPAEKVFRTLEALLKK
jgi:Putative addiction module component